MNIKLRKSTFGFTQDCELDVTNRHDGVHISIIEAEYPSLIDDSVINWLINYHRGEYEAGAHTKSQRKDAANSGFLHKRIKYLEEELESAKFAQKAARRNKIFVDGREV